MLGAPNQCSSTPRRRFSKLSATSSPKPTTRPAWSTGSMRTTPMLRYARRSELGGNEPAIVKARAAVNEKASNAKTLIEALPSSARQDAGVLFSRIQLLRRADKITEATELMLSAPHEVARIYDPDAWWVERRLLARKLFDTNAAPKAYRIVRDAAQPTMENLRVEHEFM